MFNNVGFYTKRRGFGGAGGVTPTPSRNLTITPSLSNNAETISWIATSNMAEGTLINYEITNLSNTDFTDGAVSGTIALNSNGGFTITRNLDRLINYSNNNVVFNLQVINPATSVVLGESANAVVKPATPLTATGGDTVTLVDDYYTVHIYTTTGNTSFVISNLGDYPANLTVRSLVVSGGSMGSGGSSYKESVFGAITNYSQIGGQGGRAGRATESNIAANNYSVGTVNVTVGQGSSISGPPLPENSIFGNIVPTGTTVGGASASFGQTLSPYSRIEGAGGGGRGQTSNGGDAVATSYTNVRGGAGGTGLTSDITGTSVTYACGGGGGGNDSGGIRGCTGAGSGGSQNSTTGQSAAPNTGSGGGGGGGPPLAGIPDNTYVFSNPGAGGSGIVVVRYLTRYRNMALL